MALEKQQNIKSLTKIIKEQDERIKKLEDEVFKVVKSIHHVEECNSEIVAEPREERGLKMGYQDKLTSVKNACAILPPNLKVNGRHDTTNVTAICGFIVTKDMLDYVYED